VATRASLCLGHAVVHEAQSMLQELPLTYVGFIEGHDLFGGTVEVAVCDGFSGNWRDSIPPRIMVPLYWA